MVLCIGKTKKHISFSKKIASFFSIILIFVFVSMNSCTQPDKFVIGNDLVESQTNLKILDTFKVALSTVLLDSIPTSGAVVSSGTAKILVGGYKNDEYGSVGSKSFFRLGFPVFPTLTDLSIYDSAAFVLNYSKYSYGDTTTLMSIGIHQLLKKISVDETGYLYNTSTFPFLEEEILGSKSFYPRPNSADTTVSIPVNEFGSTLWELIKRKDDVVSNSESFSEYLKGFVLTSESSSNNAIIGFNADSNRLSLTLYYHSQNDLPDASESVIKIRFSYPNDQFNNVQYDLSNTVFSELNATNKEIPASATGNRALLQGMAGIIPKVTFPTMQSLFDENRFKILKAELVFAPVKGSYSLFKLPSPLYLFDSDKHNNMNGTLIDAAGSSVISSLIVDNLYNEDTRYTFDITNFITTELSDSYFNSDHGILIGLKLSDFASTFGRLLIEDKNPAIKLRLYYLTY